MSDVPFCCTLENLSKFGQNMPFQKSNLAHDHQVSYYSLGAKFSQDTVCTEAALNPHIFFSICSLHKLTVCSNSGMGGNELLSMTFLAIAPPKKLRPSTCTQNGSREIVSCAFNVPCC